MCGKPKTYCGGLIPVLSRVEGYLIPFVLVLSLAVPVSADELLASYEPSEMTDLSFRTDPSKDPTLTITRVLGGVSGAPSATDGDYILKWVWTDESGGSMPFKIEIWHEWETRRLDLAPYNLITADVWFAEPGAQPATIGIWSNEPAAWWAPALSVPIGIGRWHTIEMDISGIDYNNISYLLAFLFEGLADKAGVLYTDNMWLRFREQVQALSPIPINKAVSMDPNVELSWTAGIYATSHDVYFGTDFNDVNDATSSSAEFKVNKSLEDTIYDPGTLEHGKTYYWRIDEIDEAGSNIWKGNIWSFKTAPREYVEVPLVSYEDSENHYQLYTGIVITGDGDSSLALEDKLVGGSTWEDVVVPEATDGSNVLGLKWTNEQDLEVEHGCTFENSSPPFRYDLYGFDEMVFDIYYAPGSPLPHSLGIFDWNFKPAHSDSSNLPTTTGQWYTIVIDVSHLNNRRVDTIYDIVFSIHGEDFNPDPDNPDNWAAVAFMDNVRLRYAASRYATHLSPTNGATDVYRNADMSWRAGNHAASHDVYFGTDYDDVNDAGTSDPEFKGNQPLDANSYDPPGVLELNTTYYWRVDEVNNAHPDKLWQGSAQSFTTGNFLVVDDFEDYNDVGNRIYDTWVDYYVNNTGMTVGHFDPPFTERGIVHTGYQSMYMRYDNDGTVNEDTSLEKTGTLFYSEAQRSWQAPQDWTREGVNSLTLWLRGLPVSVGSFTAGPPITMTAAGADIWDTADQFHFAYKRLSGVGSITAQVVSIDNTNTWAKAGVMIRQTLEPGSTHATMVVTPESGVSYQRRPLVNANSEDTTEAGITAPQWVRLIRAGNSFIGQYSANGATWTTLETVNMPMLMDVYVGLCLTGHNVDATCTAEFSNVTISGTVTGDWLSQDIGIESNIAEPMYVVLADSAGNSAEIKHPDPAISATRSWTEWNIPLADFTGVNMQAIDKITIGVGDRDNPQSGGPGDLYIDDIRLHLPPPAE